MEIKNTRKVRAVLVREGKIAVIKAKKSGAFMLPGGKLDEGETYEETLRREILEETGIEIEFKNIEGPFFQNEIEYQSTNEEGENIIKKTITSFYLVTTQQDFDYTKMKLTPREKERGSKPYWVNPGKLEYYLTNQRDKFKSAYARRYATEFLKVYGEYEQFKRKNNVVDLIR